MRVAIVCLLLLGVGLITAAAATSIVYQVYSKDLPDHTFLQSYMPPTVTRIYAGNGGLLGEFAREQRIFVPIGFIPRRLINAFLAAEDSKFFQHPGVDYLALARATWQNLEYYRKGKRLVGGSTITQQVAKNFLVGKERKLERKIREAIMSFKLERALGKERILELYLNEIYLGEGTYGVAAAASHYFDKNLSELTIAEAALLAALPKAPSNYSPSRYPTAALDRRNWVIGNMEKNQFITPQESVIAQRQPLETSQEERISTQADTGYILAEVRERFHQLVKQESLLESGSVVRTSINMQLQAIGVQVLRQGLMKYDRRHGYRGSVTSLNGSSKVSVDINNQDALLLALSTIPLPKGLLPQWRLALVTNVDDTSSNILLSTGKQDRLWLKDHQWARQHISYSKLGPSVSKMSDIVSVGDVIIVAPPIPNVQGQNGENQDNSLTPQWVLQQIPEVDGALMAMDPHSGRILAMAGGWSFAKSEFNRATQAKRQPGSLIKPFVYYAALEEGLSPISRFLDAPFVIRSGTGGALETWKPFNFSDRFWGAQPLRVGLEKSLNLMTIRLANTIGMQQVGSVLKHFEILDTAPNTLAYALGAGETTLERMLTAYSRLINGGREVQSILISHAQNRYGEVIYRSDRRNCPGCTIDIRQFPTPPRLSDHRKILADERSAFQVVHMMIGAVKRGTGTALRDLPFPVAGKTGTSNNLRDAWFVGLTPDLLAGVYVGFDSPSSLGRKSNRRQETGGSVAAPIVRDFFAEAIDSLKARPFIAPSGISLTQLDSRTNRPVISSGVGIETALKTETLIDLDTPQIQIVDTSVVTDQESRLILAPLGIGPPLPPELAKVVVLPEKQGTEAALNESGVRRTLSGDSSRQSPVVSSPSTDNNQDPTEVKKRFTTISEVEEQLTFDVY